MTQTPANITRHELIGLKARVIKAPDPTQIGISGTIRDETQQMLVIETDDQMQQLPKEDRVFQIRGDHLKVQVNGNLLIARPVDRIEQHIPRTWGYMNER